MVCSTTRMRGHQTQGAVMNSFFEAGHFNAQASLAFEVDGKNRAHSRQPEWHGGWRDWVLINLLAKHIQYKHVCQGLPCLDGVGLTSDC